eukprot:gene19433-34446_t
MAPPPAADGGRSACKAPALEETEFPTMSRLTALDLRLLAGRPQRYDPDFVREHAITFDAADGLPTSLRGAVAIGVIVFAHLVPVAVLCQTQLMASCLLEYFSTVMVWDASFDPAAYFDRS